MPAAAPPVGPATRRKLRELGQQLRDARKRLKLSATTTAEAAGMSRVTLYRLEKGEPSVTIGAWLSALDAVGLTVDVGSPQHRTASTSARLPSVIRVADWPQLQRLAWQLRSDSEVTPREALDLYERNWRHVDQRALSARERAFLEALLAKFGRERLLV
jgi:transcriptional regulator with XRE-family HTH domain